MRNKIRYYMAAACLCGLLAACSRDPFEGTDGPADGMVRLELKLDIATDNHDVTSRAATTDAQEKMLDPEKVYILVADATGEGAVLKQKPVKARMIETGKIYALLSEQKSESYIYIAANVSAATATYLAGLTGNESIADITSSLMLAEPVKAGVQAPFPMTGISGAIPRIEKGTVLPSAATSVPLVRAVARIDVKIDAAVTADNFTITGVTLVNGAKKAWLFPQSEVEVQKDMNVMRYDEVTDVNAANAITHQIYCYENNGHLGSFQNNSTRVVVKGRYRGASTDSYYGIDIAYRLPGEASTVALRYDIERNKSYLVNLRKIDRDGYSTFEEAARSAAFNTSTESDIVVTDPYAHNIVTNGKQYLGVTNSEMVIFPMTTSTRIQNVVVATISYTTESNWSLGRITLPAGLTFVQGTNERLDIGSGSTPVIREIQVDVTPSFTTGEIKIHIGDLSKTIKVTRSGTTTPAAGGVILDYALLLSGGTETPMTEYVVGEVISPSASTAWLKVSQDEDGLDPSSLQDKITNPAGQIFIHVAGNVGFDSSTKARNAQLYVAGRSDDRRIRVYVEQNAFDVYTENSPIEPFAYVGVYHRWNQTGERIIRIDASHTPSPTTHWEATVVHGDFILLSTSDSKDPGIVESNAYGKSDNALYTTDDQIESMCQVDDGARNIRGTSNYIYFKVGLTGTLASASAQPRYGLIAISHGGGIHFIYVRQGEEPDYLMRPWDPIDYKNSGVASGLQEPMSSRPTAVKMGVYHLKDRNNTLGSVNAGTRAYGFVKYPSQGGYYFFKDGSRAFDPNSTITTPGNLASGSSWTWKSTFESCPTGYRRPNDGNDQSPLARKDSKVTGSEVRQSLWLYPMTGFYNSNFSNQLKGYLADGYFDRRPIGEADQSNDATLLGLKHVAVSWGEVDVAYWGYLVFNPINYASIFLPISGCYEQTLIPGAPGMPSTTGYKVRDRGVFAGLMTTTSEPTNSCLIVNFGYINNRYVFDSYGTTDNRGSYPIRCVRDERPPVAGDGIDGETNDDIGVGDFENGASLTTHAIVYEAGHGSLQTQLEEHLTIAGATRDNINSLLITGNCELTTDDYLYLNTWADASLSLTTPLKLQHITIRSIVNTKLPAGAITSANWKSITLPDVTTVEAGAFNPTGSNGVANLRLCSFDSIAITAAAFGPEVDTSQVNLFLSGVEYDSADKTARTWAGKTWGSIKEY